MSIGGKGGWAGTGRRVWALLPLASYYYHCWRPLPYYTTTSACSLCLTGPVQTTYPACLAKQNLWITVIINNNKYTHITAAHTAITSKTAMVTDYTEHRRTLLSIREINLKTCALLISTKIIRPHENWTQAMSVNCLMS